MSLASRDLEELQLVVGSVNPFDVFMFDERDEPEDLTGALAATLSVKESETATPHLSRSTAAGNLSIDTGDSKLVATITQVEANALVPGVYIGGVAVQFADGWYHSEPFSVRIARAISGTS